MPSQAKFTSSPKPRNEAHSVRAQAEKFVQLVQKKSIIISIENNRSRVRNVDVYRAIWLVTGDKMPLDRLKKLSKGRNVVTKVHVRQDRQRKEIKAGIVAAVAKELEALKRQNPGTSQEVDDKNVDADRSSHSEAQKSANSDEMKSAESSGPSTGGAPASASEAKTSDEMSVDLSAEKSGSHESMSVAEVVEEVDSEGDAVNDAEQNVDETLYDVREPDSHGSETDSLRNTREVVEADEHSLGGAGSLPDDDAAEKRDSVHEWTSEHDPADKLREISGDELAEDDLMNIVTEQLAETNIQTERKQTPKRASQRSDEEKSAKLRPKSSESPKKDTGKQSSFPRALPVPQQGLRSPRRRSNLESDASGPSADSTSSARLRASPPRASGQVSIPNISIVVTPPEDEPRSPEE